MPIQGMVGDHPWDGGRPFMAVVTWSYVPQSKAVVHFILVDFGWWLTILGMVDDHPGDHPRQLSPGLNFAS